ncbi:hypothetical protein BC567DRAFT_298632, partial [Phyllosticta citribraziliensis]
QRRLWRRQFSSLVSPCTLHANLRPPSRILAPLKRHDAHPATPLLWRQLEHCGAGRFVCRRGAGFRFCLRLVAPAEASASPLRA